MKNKTKAKALKASPSPISSRLSAVSATNKIQSASTEEFESLAQVSNSQPQPQVNVDIMQATNVSVALSSESSDGEDAIENESDAAGVESQQCAKRQKTADELRSPAWIHFNKIVVKGEPKAQCKHCNRLYGGHSKNNGTSNLLSHIKKCKRIPRPNSDAKQPGLAFGLGICLTTDTWTSNTQINYMCLTGHFIDEDWKLHKKVLNFFPIDSHKGESIARAIEKCMVGWGIDRVFTVTVDNATSNDAAMSILELNMSLKKATIMKAKYLHVRCFAHVANLIVQDGLSLFSGAVNRIRAAVLHIKKSTQRKTKFIECVVLENLSVDKLLSLDVCTRWNSTYMMLEAAIRLATVFRRYNFIDPTFSADLCKGGGEHRVPDDSDWASARKLVSFLKKFYDLTNKVSGSLYVSSNTVFSEISGIHYTLGRWISGRDVEMKAMAEKMKLKYDKYWGNFDKINMLIYVAVVLDPRKKLGCVKFVLSQMYPTIDDDVDVDVDVGVGSQKITTIGDKYGKMVEDVVFAMYRDYQENMQMDSQGNDKFQPTNDEEYGYQIDENESDYMLEYAMRKSLENVHGVKSDLVKYLEEEVYENVPNFDILKWWSVNQARFPIVAAMARDVLAVPTSTVASESTFSTGGRVLNEYRSNLGPRMAQALICTQDWLRHPTEINIVDNGEAEKLEEELGKLVLEPDLVDMF